MNDLEIKQFLARPLTAAVATTGKDHTARVAPVWFLHEDGAILVWTGTERAWVRNVLRTPEVAITVAEQAPPFAAVVLRGPATVHEDADWAPEVIRKIAAKYIDAAELDAYLAQWDALRTVVRVEVMTQRGWARGY